MAEYKAAQRVTVKDLMAIDSVKNAENIQRDTPLGRDQNTISTNVEGLWPNVTFVLDNSAGLTTKKYLLIDPTSMPADILTAPMVAGTASIYQPGGMGQYLGVLNTDYFLPTSISPDLSPRMFGAYGLRINLAIYALMLQTSSDPTQFNQAVQKISGTPGSFSRKDISQGIEWLQSPQNFSELMLKGKLDQLLPIDIMNSLLISVMAGEVYTVTASFKAINGLPVAGQVAVPFY